MASFPSPTPPPPAPLSGTHRFMFLSLRILSQNLRLDRHIWIFGCSQVRAAKADLSIWEGSSMIRKANIMSARYWNRQSKVEGRDDAGYVHNVKYPTLVSTKHPSGLTVFQPMPIVTRVKAAWLASTTHPGGARSRPVPELGSNASSDQGNLEEPYYVLYRCLGRRQQNNVHTHYLLVCMSSGKPCARNCRCCVTITNKIPRNFPPTHAVPLFELPETAANEAAVY